MMVALAQHVILVLLSLFMVLHVCVMLKIVPYTMVWGGKLKSDREMYRFETLSIALTLLFIAMILVHTKYIHIYVPNIILRIFLWTMVAIFLLNTLGNVTSKNKFERMLTPVTIVLAICAMVLAVN